MSYLSTPSGLSFGPGPLDEIFSSISTTVSDAALLKFFLRLKALKTSADEETHYNEALDDYLNTIQNDPVLLALANSEPGEDDHDSEDDYGSDDSAEDFEDNFEFESGEPATPEGHLFVFDPATRTYSIPALTAKCPLLVFQLEGKKYSLPAMSFVQRSPVFQELLGLLPKQGYSLPMFSMIKSGNGTPEQPFVLDSANVHPEDLERIVILTSRWIVPDAQRRMASWDIDQWNSVYSLSAFWLLTEYPKYILYRVDRLVSKLSPVKILIAARAWHQSHWFKLAMDRYLHPEEDLDLLDLSFLGVKCATKVVEEREAMRQGRSVYASDEERVDVVFKEECDRLERKRSWVDEDNRKAAWRAIQDAAVNAASATAS